MVTPSDVNHVGLIFHVGWNCVRDAAKSTPRNLTIERWPRYGQVTSPKCDCREVAATQLARPNNYCAKNTMDHQTNAQS